MVVGLKVSYGITRNPNKLPDIWSSDREMIMDRARDFVVESGSVYVLKSTTFYEVEEEFKNDHD